MTRTGGICILFVFSLVFLSLTVPLHETAGQSNPYSNLETSVVWGRVIKLDVANPAVNYTVQISADNFIGKKVWTDKNGWYKVNLSAGDYMIQIYNQRGQEVGRIDVSLEEKMTRRIDFVIDPENPIKSRLYGFVFDKWDNPISGATVTLTKESPFTLNRTITAENGSYSLKVPSGKYQLTVSIDDEVEYNSTVTLGWDEKKEMNITLKKGFEEPIITLDDINKFLRENWIDIVILIVSLIIILIVYASIVKFTTYLKKKQISIIQSDWFDYVITLAKRWFIVIVLAVVIRQIAQVSPPVNEYIWKWAQDMVFPAIGIVFILFVVKILLLVSDMIWDRFKQKWAAKDKTLLNNQIISMLMLISRYAILVFGGVVILILTLSALGLRNDIINYGKDFLGKNAVQMLFLVVLIVFTVLFKKFFDLFFRELSSRTSKLSPAMLTMSKQAIQGAAYFVIALIFLFTVLSMAGLGDVGTTFILVISMIVGLVVSFAATGSIGNLLSGLVLLFMKPFEVGDRIKIGEDILGDVSYVGIMFTRIKDLDSELLEIPNNNILATTIINYTRAAQEGGFAVVIDLTLGYEINPKIVRTLLKRAASSTKGVLKDPSPRVITRAFHNHAVEYRLRAYIDNPQNMMHIRSSVMESILEVFNQEGLEVLSPLYHIKREGKTPTREEMNSRNEDLHNEVEVATEGFSMFDQLDANEGAPPA
ncbi:MAG: carboxypeptidase regulatory-like domain-containing protein [Thermoplasmatota archaeon]